MITFPKGILALEDLAEKILAGRGYAFFYWHRHRFPHMVGDTACQTGGDPRSLCRKAFSYRWSLT